jgi:RNA polymerase sigma factor (sigma-70 family)
MEAATARLRQAPPKGFTGALHRLASDRRLVERYREGEEDAFATLYERHRPRVFAICLGVLGDLQDAEDAAQEAFASAAAGLKRSAPDDLRAWLGRVARNAAIDVARSRKPRAADVETEDPPAARETASEAVARAELADLMAGLRLLADRQREALVLRELGGYSYAEIAATLESDEPAVRGLIARARVALRDHAEASAMTCSVVRERLAAELDGRRRPAELRRHLRSCQGCRDFRSQARGDARALRGLAPDPAGGLTLVLAALAALRPRAALVGGGGLLAKSSMGAKAVTVGAACVVSFCGVEGARELGASLALPVPLTVTGTGRKPKPATHHVTAARASTAARSRTAVASSAATKGSSRPLTSAPERLAARRRQSAAAATGSAPAVPRRRTAATAPRERTSDTSAPERAATGDRGDHWGSGGSAESRQRPTSFDTSPSDSTPQQQQPASDRLNWAPAGGADRGWSAGRTSGENAAAQLPEMPRTGGGSGGRPGGGF